MNLRTLMQAGPVKANELFAETKGLVADAIKDNKELRAKLSELEALPKNDEAFPERLKELQKTFRQHARDDKRELLPAVQRALSEEQVQGVAEKMEASVAEAEQAKHDEAEERRAKARQEREKADQQAEQQAAAEQAVQNEMEQKRAKAEPKREQADLQAEQARHAALRATETTTRAAGANVLRLAETATDGAQRVGEELRGAVGAYTEAARTMMPDAARIAASQPRKAITSMTEFRSAWMEWLGQTTRAGTQMSQDLLRQTAEQQQRLAVIAMQNWMDHSARVMQITMQMTQEGLRPFTSRSTAGRDHQKRV